MPRWVAVGQQRTPKFDLLTPRPATLAPSQVWFVAWRFKVSNFVGNRFAKYPIGREQLGAQSPSLSCVVLAYTYRNVTYFKNLEGLVTYPDTVDLRATYPATRLRSSFLSLFPIIQDTLANDLACI